ncbi:MAG: DNA gyrase inhibitor YacG [Pseudobdellovibrio sp.]
MKNPLTVKCPQCGQSSLFSQENSSRPFCSERCKLIDLGAWASESYKVPVSTQSYNEKDLETLYSELENIESAEFNITEGSKQKT